MKTRTCLSLLAALALAGGVHAQGQDADDAPLPPVAAGKAHVPLPISDETIGILRQHQVGALILPQGKPPFPAVIVLHGCNGVSQNTRVWARRLSSWGYAALIVDSFSARGLKQVCDGSRAFPGPERASDVFAAAAYLRTRSDIDGNRIAALGYSHGGWTALNAATQKNAEQHGGALRAIVSLYPFCPPKAAPPLASDVAIFIGDADDWAKPGNCKVFVDKYGPDARHRPLLTTYPGVRHSYDANQPERVYFGHRLAYDAQATADTVARVRTFLDERLR